MAERVQQVKGPGARPPRGVKPQVKNPMKIFTRIMKYALKDYTVHCIAVVIAIFVNVLANVQGTMFMKTLIDGYITPMLTQPDPDFGPLLHAILRVAGFYGIGIVAAFIQNRTMIYVSQGTLRNLRNDLFGNMEKLPIKYFDTHAHGDIMSIYTNDIDTLRQMISQSIPQIINSAITIVSVFVSMLILNIPLTITTLVMVSIMLGVTKKVAGFSGNFFVKQQRDLGKVNGFIEEMMEGAKVIKVFTHEQEVIDGFNKINEELFESSYKANTFASVLMPVVANIGNVSYVLSTLAGGVLAISGISGLTLGGLASFLQLNRSFNMPISNISQQMNAVAMAMAGAERIFALMDEEIEKDEGKVTLTRYREEEGKIVETTEYTGKWAWRHPRENGKVEYVPLRGEVLFHDVSFGYVPNKVVLHDIELYANPGQKIAFVGATGAGKTTITNLINRFYDIQKGSITYDGIDVKLIKKADLRGSLGIVLQDTHLFSGTIRDNIRYGKPEASEEEVIAAAKLANAHEFIRHLEHGYDTVLDNEASALSAGQRQLLTIARVFLCDPPILILDEATSSVDTRTETEIGKAMNQLMKGRTSFIIAHRLSTIRDADTILFMDHGNIIEQGSHEKLLKKNGAYAALYYSQFE